jgi:rubrerythrin
MTLVSIDRPDTKDRLHKDLEIIRMAISAELDATSLYEADEDDLNSELAKQVIRHIMLEEKGHIAELNCLLMKLDKDQEDKMSDVNPETCVGQ